MDALRWDVRHASRTIWRSPLLALTVAVSIGLGVGANATVFAWMDNIVRNPFPAIPSGGTLVALNLADSEGRVQGMPPIAYPTFEDWRSRFTSFTQIAVHSPLRLYLRTGPRETGDPAWGELVSQNFFTVLGIAPVQGRLFETGDESQRARVVVISHGYWRRRFGSDPAILGKTLLVNSVPLVVVGITPPRFGGAVVGLSFDLWVPLWVQPSLTRGPDWMSSRATKRLQAIARLKPGVTLSQAHQESVRVGRQISESYGDVPITGAGARWVSDTQLGSLMGPLSAALFVITALVLLTACANVASLLLARGVERSRETAVQLAVGATRVRIIRPLVVESLLLALFGAVIGLALAWFTKDVLPAFIPRVPLPVNLEIDLNAGVMVFAFAIAVATALIFGVAPAFSNSRPELVQALKASAPGAGTGRSRMRRALVVAQVAFSLASLATAAFFLRSVASARDLPLGFGDPSHVLLATIDLSFTESTDPGRIALVTRALERLRAQPGILKAGMSTMVPLGFGGHQMVPAKVDGYAPGPEESMSVERVVVSDGYFDTMEIPIAQGRSLDRADVAGGLRAGVVNEAFASRFWPGQDPLGRRLDLGEGWVTVVGVARNTATQTLGETPPPLVYLSFSQSVPESLTIHARTSPEPRAMIESVRRELSNLNPDLPVLDPGTLAEHMAASMFVQYVGSSVLGAFGVLALVLAGTGLYGALATAVAYRRREIALTVAIGASPRRIAVNVFGEGFRLAAIGMLCGAALSMAVAAFIRSQLVGIGGVDLRGLVASVLVVLMMIAAACIGPALRASRVDPIIALRSQ